MRFYVNFLLSHCSRICDEDDDLAEVTPEAVPDEVREWLAATFTRQAVQAKREKPKFKSVANAIRTGIFFEKWVCHWARRRAEMKMGRGRGRGENDLAG